MDPSGKAHAIGRGLQPGWSDYSDPLTLTLSRRERELRNHWPLAAFSR